MALSRWLDWPLRHPRVALASSCLLLGALAWRDRFIQDDAFIVFQYAANLVRGYGLVWQPGDRIEGYTTFLWTLLMSIPIALGIDPIRFSQLVGIAAFVGSLVATYRLAARASGSRGLALTALWLVGTNYSFNAYATGGLETQLQACFVMWAFALAAEAVLNQGWHAGRMAGISLLGAGALLTRLDSALLIVPLQLWLLIELVRRAPEPGRAWRAFAALALPALAIVGGWLAWKLSYYGDILPNTFYAKAGRITSIRQGTNFVLLFASEYSLWPFALGLVLAARPLARRFPAFLPLLSGLVLWVLYVIKIGGDFMEFRILVMAIPILMVLVVQMLSLLEPKLARVALVAGLFAGSAHHARYYQLVSDIESVPLLHSRVADPDRGWITAGRRLGEIFHVGDDPVYIATTAAGAIPYYSGLRTLDMHGLSDRYIARHGVVLPLVKPGHQRIASLEYALRQRVNLVLGHPQIGPVSSELPSYAIEAFLPREDPRTQVPPDARMLEVPLNDRYRILLLYLLPNPTVDRIIAERGYRTWALSPS